MFKTMHLFAGVGGGLLADLILGHKPIVAVEWDKYACKILRERVADGWFPGMSVWEGDVRLFDPSEYAGKVDCIHAGFPCQDISVAGKQAGLGEGTRSGLYREVLRIAGVVRPRYLFLENVAAILSNGLGVVLGDLASLGYDCRWICIRASDVGAPHGRDRWFALAERAGKEAARVGYTEHDGQPTEPQLRSHEAAGNERGQEEPQQAGQPTGTNRPADVPSIRRGADGSEWDQDVADTKCQRQQGQGQHEQSIDSTQSGDGQATQSINGGASDFWATEPNVGRVANGVAARVDRLKAIGNGQVPLCAATAFKLLKERIGLIC